TGNFGLPLALDEGIHDPVRCYRQFIDVEADRVADGVDQGWRKTCQRTFARLLGSEWPKWIVAFNDVSFDRGSIHNGRHAVFEQACMCRQAVEIVSLLAHSLPHTHPY